MSDNPIFSLFDFVAQIVPALGTGNSFRVAPVFYWEDTVFLKELPFILTPQGFPGLTSLFPAPLLGSSKIWGPERAVDAKVRDQK